MTIESTKDLFTFRAVSPTAKVPTVNRYRAVNQLIAWALKGPHQEKDLYVEERNSEGKWLRDDKFVEQFHRRLAEAEAERRAKANDPAKPIQANGTKADTLGSTIAALGRVCNVLCKGGRFITEEEFQFLENHIEAVSRRITSEREARKVTHEVFPEVTLESGVSPDLEAAIAGMPEPEPNAMQNLAEAAAREAYADPEVAQEEIDAHRAAAEASMSPDYTAANREAAAEAEARAAESMYTGKVVPPRKYRTDR